MSLVFLRRHWKIFGAIVLVYGLLNVLLVRGLPTSLDLPELKSLIQEQGNSNAVDVGLELFGELLGSGSQPTDPNNALYQPILLVIASLALIWALRQLHAGLNVSLRDAFYKGMYPLIPFILVLMVISLQLLPLIIGSFLFSAVVGNGIAVTAPEQILWGLLFFLLAVLSIYMICSSVFALYIVTLPDMTPLKALRSARQLVLHRRWAVMRKVLYLPLALLVIALVLILPLVLFATPIAEAAFFVFSMLVLAIMHSYMYTLYRELL